MRVRFTPKSGHVNSPSMSAKCHKQTSARRVPLAMALQ